MSETIILKGDACENTTITEDKEGATSNPGSWKIKFQKTYTDAINAAPKEFWASSISVMNNEREILGDIKKIADQNEQRDAVNMVYSRIQEISDKFVHDSKHQFMKADNDTRDEFISEYVSTLSVAAEMLYSCGDDFESEFGNKYYALSVKAWKQAISINSYYTKYVLNKDEHIETIGKYASKISKVEKDYKAPKINGGRGSGSFFGNLMNKLFGKK